MDRLFLRKSRDPVRGPVRGQVRGPARDPVQVLSTPYLKTWQILAGLGFDKH